MQEVEADASSDEEEAMLEVSQLMGSVDGALCVGAAATEGGTEGIEELLKQVRTEPTEDAECAAKFSIYEGYSSQLEGIRKLVFEFYEESAPTVPPAVKDNWQRQLKKVDSLAAMSVPDDDERIWFVYHMLRTAEKNNRSMTGILQSFREKIELLAKNDQTECPVCLEAFGSDRVPETLSCCHRICQECWAHWKQVTRGHPFCPLCRNEEFLGVVANRATASMPHA